MSYNQLINLFSAPNNIHKDLDPTLANSMSLEIPPDVELYGTIGGLTKQLMEPSSTEMFRDLCESLSMYFNNKIDKNLYSCIVPVYATYNITDRLLGNPKVDETEMINVMVKFEKMLFWHQMGIKVHMTNKEEITEVWDMLDKLHDLYDKPALSRVQLFIPDEAKEVLFGFRDYIKGRYEYVMQEVVLTEVPIDVNITQMLRKSMLGDLHDVHVSAPNDVERSKSKDISTREKEMDYILKFNSVIKN